MLAFGALSPPANAEPPADGTEPGLLPIVAGDSDVGLKFGAFGQLARFQDHARPYAWRSQLLLAASVRDGATGTEFPYREAAFRLDWPHAFVERLRLTLDLQWLQTTNYGYFGLGNASHAERRWAGFAPGTDAYVRARRYYQYDGESPNIRLSAREAIAPAWSRFGGIALGRIVTRPYDGSLLAHDVATATGAAKLHGTGDVALLMLGFGFAFDTRDHETVTTRGQFHELAFRLVPGTPGTEAYFGATATLRGYVAVDGERLSIAARLVGDVVTRNAPLFELSRYGGLYSGQGPGGGRGIRGIPQGRLLGRTKAIGNLELRSLFLPFTIGGQRWSLGAAAFLDAGRVWTDTLASVPALDGPAWKIHWGAGGGPRVRWGDALLLRVDVAYAPLGAELGSAPAIYFDFDQVM